MVRAGGFHDRSGAASPGVVAVHPAFVPAQEFHGEGVVCDRPGDELAQHLQAGWSPGQTHAIIGQLLPDSTTDQNQCAYLRVYRCIIQDGRFTVYLLALVRPIYGLQ